MTNSTTPDNAGTDDTEAASLLKWLRRTNFNDILDSEMHSSDFCGSRAEYIYMRVRLLALVFAALSLLWIPVDIFIVPKEALASIVYLRLTYSVLFLMLGVLAHGYQNMFLAHLRLAAFVIIPCAFYVFSRLFLNNEMNLQGALVGYSFLPYLSVVLLAIFPLTLMEGLTYASIVGITFLGSEIYFTGTLSLSMVIDIWLLTLLAGIAIWAQLAQLHMLLRLYREASRDPLTGLVNRRVLNKWLSMEIIDSREYHRPLAVLLFDLDYFKSINDTHGHLTGDRVLQAFSRLLKKNLMNFNLIGRYGGEEFIAILTDKDSSQAMTIAEKIRKSCHAISIPSKNGMVGVTVSIGVTQLLDTDTPETLINRVDKGLYNAKLKGRDMVMLADENMEHAHE